MRDILVTAIVFGSLPFILKRPWVGVLMWIWLSVMNPHRLTWSFAFDMPFAQIVGLTLLASFLISKEPKRMPLNGLVYVWLLFVIWMCVTTAVAFYPSVAMYSLEKSLKIQVPTFLALMIMYDRQRLNWMVWVLTLSLAFFGIKGGLFTLLHGGNFIVWGPKGTFIRGNNELALALVTIIPLLRFLQMHAGDLRMRLVGLRLHVRQKWIRLGLLGSTLLCAASVVGSHSRGAFLALVSMGLFLAWKSPRRGPIFAAIALLVPLVLSLAPESYWERIRTIQNYEQDSSATGRLNAWNFAWNLAMDYPITGGGFNTFQRGLFQIYAPDPSRVHVAHSNYFQVLAEHGFVGLFIYLMIALLAWRAASWTVRACRDAPELRWHSDLARMCQVSLIGYSVGGAFLSLSYFDLYYYLIAIIVLNRVLVEKSVGAQALVRKVPPVGPPVGFRGPRQAPPPSSGRPRYQTGPTR